MSPRSGVHLLIFLANNTAPVSPNMPPPAACTSLITPSYYFAITLHYCLQSTTMVLASCQVQAGTLEHTPRYTQILSPSLYHTTFLQSFHFSPDMSFVRHLIWTPLAPVWHRQTPTHWINPAFDWNLLFSVWSLGPDVRMHITLSASALHPLPLILHRLVFASTPPGLHPLCPPALGT